jgi:hypothetical protein
LSEIRGADVWLRRGCAVVVAAVAAYASYEHQRIFALRGGADVAGASLWPLSVDGLLVLATIGLLKPRDAARRRTQYAVRLAFVLGIAVSLAANVAAAPQLAWQPVLVAGWPPVALLLAVELLAAGTRQRAPEESAALPREQKPSVSDGERSAAVGESEAVREPGRTGARESRRTGSRSTAAVRSRGSTSAEEAMWRYFLQQRAKGHTPSGAELDRVVGTNNYGRAVLAQWRRTGRVPSESADAAVHDGTT